MLNVLYIYSLFFSFFFFFHLILPRDDFWRFDVCVYNRACLCMCISRIDEIRVFQIRLFFFFQEFREASYSKEVGCFLILISTIYIRRISRYLSISRIEILKCKEYSYKIKSFKIISKNKNLTEKENYSSCWSHFEFESKSTELYECARKEKERERENKKIQHFFDRIKSFSLVSCPPWHVFSTENPEEKIPRDENVKKGNSSSEGWTRFRLGRSSRQRGLVGAWVFSSTPKVETMVGVGWRRRRRERRREGEGESDRGRAKEYERVGFAGSPLLIFPARLAASSFHFRSYTLPPFSPSLSPPSHHLPPSFSIFVFAFLSLLFLSPLFFNPPPPFSSLSRATLPRRVRSRIHEIYFHVYTPVVRMHAQAHENIIVPST